MNSGEFVEILKAYRNQIKHICSQYYETNEELLERVQQASKPIDHFIESYASMKKSQLRFEKMIEGTRLSLSPVTPMLTPYNTPKDFGDLFKLDD